MINPVSHITYVKMITTLQLLRSVNSLVYRRRLEEGISELEATIHKYMEENKTDSVIISGYQVYRNNGEIDINEAPKSNVDQLILPLNSVEDHYES